MIRYGFLNIDKLSIHQSVYVVVKAISSDLYKLVRDIIIVCQQYCEQKIDALQERWKISLSSSEQANHAARACQAKELTKDAFSDVFSDDEDV